MKTLASFVQTCGARTLRVIVLFALLLCCARQDAQAQGKTSYKGTLARYELVYYRMLNCSGSGQKDDSTKMTLQLDQTQVAIDASGTNGCPFATFTGTFSFTRPQAEVSGTLDATEENLVFGMAADPISATLSGTFTTLPPLDSVLETRNIAVVIDYRGAEGNISKCTGGTDFAIFDVPAPGTRPLSLAPSCTPLGLRIDAASKRMEQGKLVGFEAWAAVYAVVDMDGVFKDQNSFGELSHLCIVRLLYSFSAEDSQLELVFDPPEIRCGEFSTVEVRVKDAKGNLLTDYDGGVTLRIVQGESTKDISRLQAERSLLITDGKSQPEFIFTPKEPFSSATVITSSTPLSGTLVLEAELENSSIPKVKKTLEVRSPLDFAPERIELQQGIADREKSVVIEYAPGQPRTFDPLPLIAERPTVIRVFPSYTNPNSIPFSKVASLDGFSADVEVLRDGSPAGSLELTKGASDRAYTFRDSYSLGEKSGLSDALGALLPAGLIATPGNYEFKVTLKNSTAVRERAADLANNTKSAAEPVVGTKPISLLLSTGYVAGESEPVVDLKGWPELTTVLPVQASRASFTAPGSLIQQFSSSVSDVSFGTLSRTLARWNQNNPADQRRYHIMFATMPIINKLCIVKGAGGCAVGVIGDVAVIAPSGGWGAVHELGHLLGLRDTYTTPNYPTAPGDPNPRRIDATSGGNRIQDGSINLFAQPLEASGPDNILRDLMGAGPWIDRVEWDYLYRQRFRIGGPRFAPEPPAGRFIAISGEIARNDAARLDPFIVLDAAPSDPDTLQGNFAVLFSDDAGAALSRWAFPLEFHVPGGGDRDTVPFGLTAPLPDRTKRVAIVRRDAGTGKDVTLTERRFSANAPAVRVLAPRSGPLLSGDVTLRWTASDPDGDALMYDVLFSPDGVAQMVAAVMLRDTQCVINTRTLRSSSSAYFTVIASDGVNEGRGRSEQVSVTQVEQRGDPFARAGDRPALDGVYPHPFGATGVIRCSLPRAGRARVQITDLLGRVVAVVSDQEQAAGVFELRLDARGLPAGLYRVTLDAEGMRVARTVLHVAD